MIILITGATRIGGRLLRPADGPFEADPKVEARLVRAGVARYFGEDFAAPAASLPLEPRDGAGAGENTPALETPQEPLVGSLDTGQLSTMTNANLKKLAEDMGLDASKCRVKADYVALISEAEVSVPAEDEADEEDDTVDDGELPPDLEAEAPVV